MTHDTGVEGTDLIAAVRFIEAHECVIYTGPAKGIDVYLRDERIVGSGKNLCSAVHVLRQKLKVRSECSPVLPGA